MSNRHILAIFALGLVPLAAFYFFRMLFFTPLCAGAIQSLPYINAVDASTMGLSTRGIQSVLAAALAGYVWVLSQRSYLASRTIGIYVLNVLKTASLLILVPVCAFLFALNYLGLRADVCMSMAVGLMVLCYRRLQFAPTPLMTQGGGRIDQ